ncbi:PDZ domain-containing protein [Altererythrobacter confluentis]|uniref:PDZ domain-containing protein n=1 Tax=Allopontixanthobacter confluentis TaxID=1849021 RepID=A0A6L7GC25_9SPHN|nr:S41 family peptidase [Allopontixanthobacter confluentis]MXP13602.1 PDZ domain-containing protein [Allopontixanthobacter confluentis]
MHKLNSFIFRFRVIIGVLALTMSAIPKPAVAQPASMGTVEERVADIDWLIDTIASRYAYLDEEQVDLEAMRVLYRQEAIFATTRNSWLHVLEDLLANLHDHHVNLNQNARSSSQLVPSGTDIWARIVDNHAIVTEVLPKSPAAEAGLQAGDEIVAIGDTPTMIAIAAATPPATTPDHAGDYILRVLLAGDHERVRVLTLADGHRIVMPPYVRSSSPEMINWRWLDGNIGYIRIENSLGADDTVAAFDTAVEELHGANGLVLDLRFTPNGGNTGVAIPILGRFVSQSGAYQRYEGEQFEGGVELDTVNPRGPFTITAPVVVLVGHWTGSMGEGMAIGLDALERATTIGTPMAGLRGGIKGFALPNTGVGFGLPVFRIFHINGTPREAFDPSVLVDLTMEHGADPVLAAGVEYLHQREADLP